MTGRMVRTMRFQSSLMEMGTTGWMLAVYFIALAGPMPKSQLFWIGTLMRAATGGWGFLVGYASCAALSSAAPPPPEVSASAGARVKEPSKVGWFWAWAVDHTRVQAKANAAVARFCL